MDRKVEENIVKISLRTQKRRFNAILNKLDLIRRNIKSSELLEKIDINEHTKSKLIRDLKFYDRRIKEMKDERLDDVIDEDLEDKEDEEEAEEETEELDDLVKY